MVSMSRLGKFAGRGTARGLRRKVSGGELGGRVLLGLGLLVGFISGCEGWRLKGATRTPLEARAEAKPSAIVHLKEREFGKVEPIEDQRATFLLDGAPFCFHGTNEYYLTYKSKAMTDDAIAVMQRMGMRVLRHWAFIDRGSLDGSVKSVRGDGTADGVYFQYWDTATKRPAYNDGEDGLERLDYLMYKAREADIRVVLVLTNNWQDFGGMDQYLAWYGLKQHPEFYTDGRVQGAFKDYIAHLLNRVNTLTGVAYKDDPYVFAWNLANEPRIRNYTSTDPKSKVGTQPINDWAKDISEYIRSIDPYHMISVGDEGQFNNGKVGFYDGSDGVDHEALLSLPQVDYGTFHLYPDTWTTGFVAFGDKWIEDHLQAARTAGKPTMLEEYGCKVERDVKTKAILHGFEKRERVYNHWHELMTQRGGSGSLVWMVAGIDDKSTESAYYGDYDGFAVYDPNVDPTGKLLSDYARRAPVESRACSLASGLAPKRQVPAGFVVPTAAPKLPAVAAALDLEQVKYLALLEGAPLARMSK
jgi:mannan endo-1,4-beta-mannosidase